MSHQTTNLFLVIPDTGNESWAVDMDDNLSKIDSGTLLLNPVRDQIVSSGSNRVSLNFGGVNGGAASFNILGTGSGALLGDTSLLDIDGAFSGWIATFRNSFAGAGLGIWVDTNGDSYLQSALSDGTFLNQIIFRASGNIRIGQSTTQGIGVDSSGNVQIGGLGLGSVLTVDGGGGINFPSQVLTNAFVKLIAPNNHSQFTFVFPDYGSLVTGTATLMGEVTAPVNPGDPGLAGQLARDPNFIYSCISTNNWKRATLNGWAGGTTPITDGIQTLSVSGSVAFSGSSNQELVLGTGGSGGITVTIPTAVGIAGQSICVKKVDAGVGAVTLSTTAAQTIDGVTTYALTNQYQYVTLESDNANWNIVGNN